MDPAKVMTEIGQRLGTIEGLRVWDWPPGSVSGHAAILGLPESISFDQTYDRGMDRMMLPVIVAVPLPTERQSRDGLLQYCGGSGPKSVKAVVESGEYTAFDLAIVKEIDFDVTLIGGNPHMVAVCTLDIVGSGDPA